MGLSANKGDIRDTGGKFIFSITGATKKEKTMDEKHLADNYKNLIGKYVVKSESLKLTSDVTAKTLKKGLSNCSKLVQKRFTTCIMGMENVKWDVPTCTNDKTSRTTSASEDNQMWL